MNIFSERLERLMEEQGHSQTSLASVMRTNQSTVIRWLNGSIPRGRMMADIEKTLGVSRHWLLGVSDYRNGYPLSDAPSPDSSGMVRCDPASYSSGDASADGVLSKLSSEHLRRMADLTVSGALDDRQLDLVARIAIILAARDNTQKNPTKPEP